jgi:hypothetical protein
MYTSLVIFYEDDKWRLSLSDYLNIFWLLVLSSASVMRPLTNNLNCWGPLTNSCHFLSARLHNGDDLLVLYCHLSQVSAFSLLASHKVLISQHRTWCQLPPPPLTNSRAPPITLNLAGFTFHLLPPTNPGLNMCLTVYSPPAATLTNCLYYFHNYFSNSWLHCTVQSWKKKNMERAQRCTISLPATQPAPRQFRTSERVPHRVHC